ncbi:MAG: biotin/lipoyl-binding protein, partial [Steroidobacteraceae bacterium]
MKAWLTVGVAGILLGPLAGATPPGTFMVRAQSDSASYAATGTIEAIRQGTLGSQVSGRVMKVLVRNGDAVRAGQPLIQIEAGDSGDAAVASGAAARGAAARLVSARADFERAQRLRAQDYVS